mmetsp:Transcript_22565/g.38461  ORF Transcript_22565/g.38461 Transcript_22565/m.38461 type:complete len:213 (+) Transcript_22565:1316-1954(+)
MIFRIRLWIIRMRGCINININNNNNSICINNSSSSSSSRLVDMVLIQGSSSSIIIVVILVDIVIIVDIVDSIMLCQCMILMGTVLCNGINPTTKRFTTMVICQRFTTTAICQRFTDIEMKVKKKMTRNHTILDREKEKKGQVLHLLPTLQTRTKMHQNQLNHHQEVIVKYHNIHFPSLVIIPTNPPPPHLTWIHPKYSLTNPTPKLIESYKR